MTQNPFHPDRPVTEPGLFFGRTTLVMRIYSRMIGARPQSVSIIGNPKIGKSSLLRHLASEPVRNSYLERPEDYIFAYLPLTGESHLSVPALFRSLNKLLLEQVMHWLPSNEAQDPQSLFRYIVETTHQFQKKVIIFFDDFQLITRNTSFPTHFFSLLRSLANNYQIAYITTSANDLQTLCSLPEVRQSSFFNIFTNMSLKPFAKSEAIALLEEPLDEAGIHVKPFTERLLELTGHFPYTIHLAGYHLYKMVQNAGGVDKLNFDDFEETFYREAAGFYEGLWGLFGEDQKSVLEMICKSKKIKQSQEYLLKDLLRQSLIVSGKRRNRPFSISFERFIAEKFGFYQSSLNTHSRIIGRVRTWLK